MAAAETMGRKGGATRVPRGEALLIKEARERLARGLHLLVVVSASLSCAGGEMRGRRKAVAAKRAPSARDADKSKGGARGQLSTWAGRPGKAQVGWTCSGQKKKRRKRPFAFWKKTTEKKKERKGKGFFKNMAPHF